MPAPFSFDQSWTFPVDPPAFWETIRHVEDYPRWWRFLHRFDADGLYLGAHADAVIQASLPFRLTLGIDVIDLVEGERVEAWVSGDLSGPARLEVTPDPAGCRARLVWTLELRQPILRTMALVARPALVWSHDRVVELGVTQFQRQALGVS